MSNLLDKASIILTPTAYNNGEALCVKPSDGSGDFDFSRNSAATRVNAQGLVENVQILSSNLVQNGDFSEEGVQEVSNGSFTNGSTDWNLIGTATITENQANIVTASAVTGISQSNILTIGKSYKLSYNIVSNNNGGLKISGNEIPSAVGNNTYYFEASAASLEILRNSGITDISITNISVKEVGMDWTLQTGWSIAEDKATFDETIGGAGNINQNNILAAGKNYKLTFDTLETNGGNIAYRFGGGYTFINAIQANTTHTVYGVGSGTQFTLRGADNFIGSITNISVIEITTDTNLPRINYEGFSFDGSGNIVPDSGCGSWLFEPQSTNLITYSEDFTQWAKVGTPTITSNYSISPDGTQNSTRVEFDANERIYFILSASGDITFSVYLKGSGVITLRDNTNAHRQDVTLTSEWARYDLSFNATITSIQIQNQTASIVDLEIWGAMLEENSYSTSLIPTSGSTVTRNQDVCTNGGSLATINSSEGVLYAEIAALANDGTRRYISLNDGTSANDVRLYFDAVANKLIALGKVAGITQFVMDTTSFTLTDFNKIAVKFSENDFALWVNGAEVDTDTSGLVNAPNTFNQLTFDGNGLKFFGKTKALAVWKEALSDSELQSLTTI